jgi:hypothetical protein
MTTTYSYKLPDGSTDAPDAQGNHTSQVNVLHSAELAARFPGCGQCARIVLLDAHSAVHASIYSGWDGTDFAESRVECRHPAGTPCWPLGETA